MKKPSQKNRVLKLLRENGRITRNQCLSMFPAISRLGAIMCDLKKEGINFEVKRDKGDYVYLLLDRPKEKIEYRVAGELVHTKVIW